MSKQIVTYDYDADYSQITFYINLVEVACWSCDGDPEDAADEFRRVLLLGVKLQRESVAGKMQEFLKSDESLTLAYLTRLRGIDE